MFRKIRPIRQTNIRRISRMGIIATAILAALCHAPAAKAVDREEVQYNVVVSLFNAGKWREALAQIDKRLKEDLTDNMRARYLYARGMALETGEDPAAARTTYAKLIETLPEAEQVNDAKVAIIYIDYARDNWTGIIDTYATVKLDALEQAQQRDLALMFGQALYARDVPDQALTAYNRALELGASREALAARLLELYARTGDHQQLLAVTAQPVAGVKEDLQWLLRSESMLALKQWDKAAAEAARVPAESDYIGAAALVRARALLQLDRGAEAAQPLATAIAKLANPPPSAYVALAECLVEAKQPDEAKKAMADARKVVAALPDDHADKTSLAQKLALLELHLLSDSGNHKALVAAIARDRERYPAEQLAQLLYLKLYALSELDDHDALLDSMADDYPTLQKSAFDGAATLLYFAALNERKKTDQARDVLEAYVARQPESEHALRARFELARMAIDAGEDEAADKRLSELIADKRAAEVLGPAALSQTLYNRAVIAARQQRNDEAVAALTQLLATKPDADLTSTALVLLGETHLAADRPAQAAEAWEAALATGQVKDPATMHERIGKVRFNLKQPVEAAEQFTKAAELRGGESKLDVATRRIHARALHQAGHTAEAAARFADLADGRHDDRYNDAFEAAVLYDRAGKPQDAEKLYTLAQKNKSRLSEAYAQAVDETLASLRLREKLGDLGLDYWLSCLGGDVDDARFAPAAAALRQIAAGHRFDKDANKALAVRAAAYTAKQARHYDLAAVQLLALWSEVEVSDSRKTLNELSTLAEKLGAQLEDNEAALIEAGQAPTVAAAMIYFFLGEAQRREGNIADALVSYETVLAVYPYNQWPDAATCGAADCFAALGDIDTAIAKFDQVIQAAAPHPDAKPWREYATRRVTELNETK